MSSRWGVNSSLSLHTQIHAKDIHVISSLAEINLYVIYQHRLSYRYTKLCLRVTSDPVIRFPEERFSEQSTPFLELSDSTKVDIIKDPHALEKHSLSNAH